MNLNKALSSILPSREQVTLSLRQKQSVLLSFSGLQLLHCQDSLRLSVLEVVGINTMAVVPLVGCPLILIPPPQFRHLDSKYRTPE